jgi:metal-sulfur cluster biosynthetic enzyme
MILVNKNRILSDQVVLGLIRKVDVVSGDKVEIDMTVTSPGCPIAPQLMQAVENRVRTVNGVIGVSVNLVLNPPWDSRRDPTAIS